MASHVIRRFWPAWLLAAIVLVIGFGLGSLKIVDEMRWRNFLHQDLEFFLESHFAFEGQSDFDYRAYEIPGSYRKCFNPLTEKTEEMAQYRIEPREFLQQEIDDVNTSLSESSARRGDIFAREARGIGTDNRIPSVFFHGDEAAIERYRKALNEFDGSSRMLTVETFVEDPALGMFVALYSNPNRTPASYRG